MLAVLQAPATHLYPGLTGTLGPGDRSLPDGSVDCVVEFSDGSVAYGCLEAGQGARRWLALAAHTTARGTAIPPKRWHMAIAKETDGTVRFRVAARGPKTP